MNQTTSHQMHEYDRELTDKVIDMLNPKEAVFYIDSPTCGVGNVAAKMIRRLSPLALRIASLTPTEADVLELLIQEYKLTQGDK